MVKSRDGGGTLESLDLAIVGQQPKELSPRHNQLKEPRTRMQRAPRALELLSYAGAAARKRWPRVPGLANAADAAYTARSFEGGQTGRVSHPAGPAVSARFVMQSRGLGGGCA